MKNIICILIAWVFTCVLSGQGIYNNGGKLIVGSGAFLNITGPAGNYRNETNVSNGSVDLTGTLQVEGNILNNVAATDIFLIGSTGTLVLNGTALQTIGGSTTAPLTLNNLTVNNPGGISLAKNIQVNGVLTLTAGLMNLGTNDMTLGLASTIAGTPSASNMIVATGSGQLKKLFSGIGTFQFPVGDNNLTAKYSPVNIDITAGTFAAGSAIGINLVNSNYADPIVTGSYINRYWNLTNTGITGLNCNATFQYLASDVTGTETNIYCLQVLPTPINLFNPANITQHQLIATGLTSLGTFTGAPGYRTINLTLFLEGLYNGAGTMRQAQGIAGNQFTGTVSDAISVELHDAALYATTVYTASNVNLNNNGLATFTVPATYSGTYYLTVKHRSSIATVTSTPVSLASMTTNYNFSTMATQAFGGNLKNVGGVFVIYGGDVDQDGFVGVTDMMRIDNQSTLFGTGYLAEDINGDGFVGVTDMMLVDNNAIGFISVITP